MFLRSRALPQRLIAKLQAGQANFGRMFLALALRACWLRVGFVAARPGSAQPMAFQRAAVELGLRLAREAIAKYLALPALRSAEQPARSPLRGSPTSRRRTACATIVSQGCAESLMKSQKPRASSPNFEPRAMPLTTLHPT